jgi:hypothetical protein
VVATPLLSIARGELIVNRSSHRMTSRVELKGVLAALALSAGAFAQPPSFQDDFEAGVLLTQADGGVWEKVILGPSPDSIGVGPGAAHRGANGLRAFDSRSTAFDRVLVLYGDAGTWDGGYFVRGWLRLPLIQDGGEISVLQLERVSGAPLPPPFFAVHAFASAGASGVGVLQSAGANGLVYTHEDGGAMVDLHAWHLVEAAVDGIGTTAGTRTLFVDGQQADEAGGLDFGGQVMDAVSVGEAFDVGGTFAGLVDWDDVRGSPTRPASTLVLFSSNAAVVPSGSCLDFSVGLDDSIGRPAPAPYDVVLNLIVTGADAGFFSGAGCGATGPVPTLRSGALQYSGSLRVVGAGPATFSASHLDFVSGAPKAFLVSNPDAAVTPDAGPPGGTDGGSMTASLGCAASSLAPLPALLAIALILVAFAQRGRRRG